jgi:deoxycytidylate deaminase
LVVTTPPCLGCARLIHHAGIERVVIGGRSYDSQGADYLERFMALRQGVSHTCTERSQEYSP